MCPHFVFCRHDVTKCVQHFCRDITRCMTKVDAVDPEIDSCEVVSEIPKMVARPQNHRKVGPDSPILASRGLNLGPKPRFPGPRSPETGPRRRNDHFCPISPQTGENGVLASQNDDSGGSGPDSQFGPQISPFRGKSDRKVTFSGEIRAKKGVFRGPKPGPGICAIPRVARLPSAPGATFSAPFSPKTREKLLGDAKKR